MLNMLFVNCPHLPENIAVNKPFFLLSCSFEYPFAVLCCTWAQCLTLFIILVQLNCYVLRWNWGPDYILKTVCHCILSEPWVIYIEARRLSEPIGQTPVSVCARSFFSIAKPPPSPTLESIPVTFFMRVLLPLPRPQRLPSPSLLNTLQSTQEITSLHTLVHRVYLDLT